MIKKIWTRMTIKCTNHTVENYIFYLKCRNLKKHLTMPCNHYKLNGVGVDDVEGTPVPISNTVVKLNGAEDTWLATAWENRKMPTFLFVFFR